MTLYKYLTVESPRSHTTEGYITEVKFDQVCQYVRRNILQMGIASTKFNTERQLLHEGGGKL